MIYFVGTSPPLRKALWVAMTTIHFHIAKLVYLWGYFRIQGVPGNNLAPIHNCLWGARYVKLDPGVVSLRPKSVYLVCLFRFSSYL